MLSKYHYWRSKMLTIILQSNWDDFDDNETSFESSTSVLFLKIVRFMKKCVYYVSCFMRFGNESKLSYFALQRCKKWSEDCFHKRSRFGTTTMSLANAIFKKITIYFSFIYTILILLVLLGRQASDDFTPLIEI